MGDLREQNYESFLGLYRSNEGRIFRYILALLPNYQAAEDIMQDTMLVMWRKYDQFEAGSNFAAWGMKIARFGVLKYRRTRKSGIVHFDTDTVENISGHVEGVVGPKERIYLEALEECTKKLPENSRKMVSLRYMEQMKIIDIALKMEKTLNSTYKVMSRIHHALLNCIELKLAESECV